MVKSWLRPPQLLVCAHQCIRTVVDSFAEILASVLASQIYQISNCLCPFWDHFEPLFRRALAAMASDGEEKKVFSLKEVAQHVAQEDCWMVIHGKVYDVSNFMDDHPGGDDVLLQTAGQDATEEFDDVGHSKSAIEQLKDFYVGECPEVLEKKVAPVADTDAKLAVGDSTSLTNSVGIFSKVLQFLLPLVLLGVAVAIRKYGRK